MKPRTTFTEFNQPPLFGKFFNNDGNHARSVNGRANAIANAAIVKIGIQMLPPDVELMITLPTIGPVHENDTNTSVKAIKKIPIKPPLSAPASLLLTSDEGNVISNAPRNDAAKTMKMTKKIRLGIQCVPIALKISPATFVPKALERSTSTAMGNT